MISPPLAVELPPGADLSDPAALGRVADANQDRLKRAGDWVVFPRTIEEIARGNFGRNEDGTVYYRGEKSPGGVRLEA
jgi:hypothetical protein